MSALGDYIHYRKENYITYGTHEPNDKGKKNPYAAGSFDAIIQDRLGKMTASEVSQEVLQELKRRLKYQSASQDKADQERLEKREKEIVDALVEDMLQNYGDKIVGHYQASTGSALGNEKWAGTTITKGMLKERAQALYRKLDPLLIELEKTQGKAVNRTQLLILSQYLKEAEDLGKGELSSKSLVQKIQELTNNTNYSNAYQLAVGDFGEKFVAMADDRVYNIAANEVIKEINQLKLVQGNSMSGFSVSAEDVADKYLTAQAKDILLKGHMSKNKVDAEIIVNNELISASIKYYKGDNPTLQSRTSLLYSLVYLNKRYEDFGNHWINMHLWKSAPGKGNADLRLKQELAYEALVSGNPLKQNSSEANTFVYLNRRTGDINVYSTRSILASPSLMNMIVFSPRIETISLRAYNKYKGKQNDMDLAQERISELLQRIHMLNIHSVLKITAKELSLLDVK